MTEIPIPKGSDGKEEKVIGPKPSLKSSPVNFIRP